MRVLESLAFFLFLSGVLLAGIFGTWTVMAPMWLAAPLIWTAAIATVLAVRQHSTGHLAIIPATAFLLFTGWITFRALTSDVRSLALQDLFFAGTGAIGYGLMATRFTRPSQRFAILGVWGALILLNLGTGLYQLSGHPSANPLWFLGLKRPVVDAVFGGLFPSSNHLCGFLELTAFPLLALALYKGMHSFVRLVCVLVFAAAVAGIALSTSRGGLAFGLGLLVLGGILAVLRAGHRAGNHPANRRAGSPVLAGFIALLAAAGYLASRALEDKFGEGRIFANLNGRTGMWQRAIEQWQLSPITGTGARSYEYYERSFRDLRTDWTFWNEVDIDAVFTHNDWLQVLADYGLVGLLLTIAVLFTHTWRGLTFALSQSDDPAGGRTLFPDYRGPLSIGITAGLCAFALHCAGDFHMHVGVNVLTAGMLLGMLANPGEPDSRRLHSSPVTASPSRLPAGVALVLSAAAATLMLAATPRMAAGDWHFRRALTEFSNAESLEGYLRAAAGFAKSADANPEDPITHLYWAICDLKAADEMPPVSRAFTEKAIGHLENGIRLYPPHPNMALWLGRSCDALQRYDEAESWFQQALRWGNGSREVHHKYGDHLVFTGRPAEALPHFLAAMHRYPEGTIDRWELKAKVNYCLAEAKKRTLPQSTDPAQQSGPSPPESSPR
jgi:O-antigen ligase